MTDYQGNSKKNKPEGPKPEKKIQRVTQEEVIVQKKSVATRLKGVLIAMDFGSVVRHVVYENLIPGARNMVYSAIANGAEKWIFGESSARRRNTNLFGQPRFQYNQPVSRPYSSGPFGSSSAPSLNPGPRGPTMRGVNDDFILSSRQEAELVLERMNDCIDQFDVVTVGDLYELIGAPSSHTDQKWGWTVIGDVPIRQVRDGYIIDLPPTEAVQ